MYLFSRFLLSCLDTNLVCHPMSGHDGSFSVHTHAKHLHHIHVTTVVVETTAAKTPATCTVTEAPLAFTAQKCMSCV